MKKTYIIHHSQDFDGFGAARILQKKMYQDAILIPYNYEKVIRYNDKNLDDCLIGDETIIFVDVFYVHNDGWLESVMDMGVQIMLFDHHKFNIKICDKINKEYNEGKTPDSIGYNMITGCMKAHDSEESMGSAISIVYSVCYNTKLGELEYSRDFLPRAVRLISDYDVGEKHCDDWKDYTDGRSFVFGLLLHGPSDYLPNCSVEKMDDIFNMTSSEIDNTIQLGSVNYLATENRYFHRLDNHSVVKELMIDDYPTLCCLVVDYDYDLDLYQKIFNECAFIRNDADVLIVISPTLKDNVSELGIVSRCDDAKEIAQHFNGDGHKERARGWTTENLFE
ncbi:MAG: hypothetical protein ACRC5M_04410 [Anaeroplasmataceae bacterium]